MSSLYPSAIAPGAALVVSNATNMQHADPVTQAAALIVQIILAITALVALFKKTREKP